MGLVRTVAPATEPVSLTEAKAQCRIDGTAENDLLTALIAAARTHLEEITWRALITQTWRLTLRGFPTCNAPIYLPRPPLIAVSSITYVDTAGTTQTLASGDYTVDAAAEPGTIEPAWGLSWPLTRDQPAAVTITYTAGFGNAAAVPSDLVHALKLLIGHWSENREAVAEGGLTEVPLAVQALVAPWLVRDDRILEAL